MKYFDPDDDEGNAPCRKHRCGGVDRHFGELVRELIPLMVTYIDEGRLPSDDEGTLNDLMTLAALMTRLVGPPPYTLKPAPHQPSTIDEYIEDMIDPEFGLRPARKTIERAAQQILGISDQLHGDLTTQRRRSRRTS